MGILLESDLARPTSLPAKSASDSATLPVAVSDPSSKHLMTVVA